LQINAISATPSYMLPLAEAALAQGIRPAELELRKGFFGAEPGMNEPGVRARMEETWGMAPMDANFGMAVVLCIMGAECEQRQGLHFQAGGIVAVELIEPETGTPLALLWRVSDPRRSPSPAPVPAHPRRTDRGPAARAGEKSRAAGRPRAARAAQFLGGGRAGALWYAAAHGAESPPRHPHVSRRVKKEASMTNQAPVLYSV
jgi:hypothetical protein